MKKISILSAAGCAAFLAILHQPAQAQVAVEQTTTATTATRSAGTLTTFDPAAGTVVLTSEAESTPMSYTYSKQTRVVDSTGAAVSVEAIKPGVPVEVYYVPGDVRTIERIVVQQPVPVSATTTTTTTAAPAPAPAIVKEEITTTTTTTTNED